MATAHIPSSISQMKFRISTIRTCVECITALFEFADDAFPPWRDGETGQACRMISIPEGMTLVDGLRAVGGFTTSELDQVGRAHPNPINSASLLVIRRRA
jgi:hypothetical protein